MSVPEWVRKRPANFDPRLVYEYTKENPELVHYAAMVVADVAMLAYPPTRFIALAVPGITVVGHLAGHLLWDSASYLHDTLWSSESSPSSYQQGGGSGGTKPRRQFKNIDAIPAGSRVTKPTWKTTETDYIGNPSKGYHYCKKGWILVRVGDTNMCWKPPRK